ncbi:MAG: DUF1566 domain-containing protein [Patescibacteria group bacterium]|jgi:hypothetical protein
MNAKLKNILKTVSLGGLTVILSVLIIYSVTKAGSLTPPGSEATSTGYTLEDIYNRLFDNSTAIFGNHDFEPSASPTSTMHTIDEIYGLIPFVNASNLLSSTTYLGVTGNIQSRTLSSSTTTISAGYYGSTNLNTVDTDLATGNIKSGINIFGIAGSYGSGGYTYGSDIASHVLTSAGVGAGTFNAYNLNSNLIATGTVWGTSSVGMLLGHLFNGTISSSSIIGGNQANGGVEDYNNSGSAPSDRYSKAWTQCVSGGTYNRITNPGANYCGTGDSGAAYMDNSTALIWSKGMNATTYVLDDTSGTMTWYIANNCTEISGNYCTKLTSAKTGCEANSGWYLPHQRQLMQAYIDGSYGILIPNGNNRSYWSATTRSDVVTNAWHVNLGSGSTSRVLKTDINEFVRCVHSAN